MRRIVFFCFLMVHVFADHDYRVYDENTKDHVRDTYHENHIKQTLATVLQKKSKYEKLAQKKMSVWEAMEYLNDFKDESDPDTELPQIVHAFQTAEAIRRDGHPRWMILTGLIHDLGKMLYAFGEEQWSVVGDTFPVGCKFDDSIVFSEYFSENPDSHDEVLSSKLGIYQEGCGFDALHMSYGHDEYLYHVMKPYLPEEALYLIRFHSFYPAHHEKAYEYFMNEKDRKMMPILKLFSSYDLYSKVKDMPSMLELESYYKDLVDEFLPPELAW